MLPQPRSPLPALLFEETDWRGALDIRRWRAGERNTRLGASPINGRGSFAILLIPRGGPIMVREPRNGNFPVNHSDHPNAARASNRAGLFALRDIASGEEITEDYRFLPYFAQAIPNLPQQLVRATPREYREFVAGHKFTLEGQHLTRATTLPVPCRRE